MDQAVTLGRMFGISDEIAQQLFEKCGHDLNKYLVLLQHIGRGKKDDHQKKSLFKPYSEHPGECHYCGPPYKQDRWSYGCGSSRLNVEDYQDLIDRGWRRSGGYLYKPTNPKCCCPNYTIRLEVTKFKMSKSQKRVLKKFEKYLKGVDISKTKKNEHENANVDTKKDHETADNTILEKDKKETEVKAQILDALRKTIAIYIGAHLQIDESAKKNVEDFLQKTNAAIISHATTAKAIKERGNYFSDIFIKLKFSCKLDLFENNKEDLIAQFIALLKQTESFPQKLNAEIRPAANNNNNLYIHFSHSVEDTADSINNSSNRAKNSFDNNGGAEKKRKTSNEVIELPVEQPKKKSFNVELVSNKFNEEAYQIYRKYQMKIHKDEESECTKDQYERFLCKSTLMNNLEKNPGNDPECGYGAFHQHYRIEGKLFAVGVVDILPKCLSSVYFFYDPDYFDLSPGVLSALMEIKWVQTHLASHPNSNLKYYYLGYYVHSCPKMRYKGTYKPSELLCSETYNWVPLEKCIPLLNNQRYARFSPADAPNQKESCPNRDKHSIALASTIYLDGEYMSPKDLNNQGKKIVLESIETFIDWAGSDIAKRSVFGFN